MTQKPKKPTRQEFEATVKEGLGEYARIIKERDHLKAKAAREGEAALAKEDRVFIRFAGQMETILPAKCIEYWKEHDKMLRKKHLFLLAIIHGIPPLKRMHDKHVNAHILDYTKARLAFAFNYSMERSRTDIQKRDREEQQLRQKTQAARDEERLLQEALDSAAVLENPLKIGKPVALKNSAA